MDYTALYNYLEKEMGRESVHVLRDTWWVDMADGQDVSELADKLRKYMGDKDVFYINKVINGNIDGWLGSSSWDFYRKNGEKG